MIGFFDRAGFVIYELPGLVKNDCPWKPLLKVLDRALPKVFHGP